MNKPGYKKTALGWFPEAWEIKKIGELQPFITSGSRGWAAYYSDDGDLFIRITNMNRNSIFLDLNDKRYVNLPKIGSEGIRTRLCEGDVLISITADIGIIGLITSEIPKPAYINQHIALIRFKQDQLNTRFICYFLASELMQKHFRSLTDSGAKAGMNLSTVQQLQLVLPPLPEQIKIAKILSNWDKAITQIQQLIKAKQRLKLGLMRKLLTKCVAVPLGQVLTRVDEPVILESDQIYREIGIRSHGKGIFIKEDTNAETIGDKRVYWVKKDCFIVNIVFAWERAIAITSEKEAGCIASHRFPMYKPNPDKLNLRYLLYFFLSDKGVELLKLASPGGAGRNKTLGQDNFKKTKIPLPSIEEQNLIASTLSCCDQEIDLLQKKLSNIQCQKQGLMQKLLTGQIRVKVGN